MEKYFDVYGGGGVEMGVSIDACRCTTLTLGDTISFNKRYVEIALKPDFSML